MGVCSQGVPQLSQLWPPVVGVVMGMRMLVGMSGAVGMGVLVGVGLLMGMGADMIVIQMHS